MCGFHYSKKLIDISDVILMPYNYIFDSSYWEAHWSLFENSIIVFDEAHNLENIAEEGSSISFSSGEFEDFIKETDKYLNKGIGRRAGLSGNSIVSI